jgi:uncharacterized protein (DUF2147 family)
MKALITALTLSVLSATAFAQANPAGLWRTIDDETKQEKSLVRITDAGGVLSGKVEKVADPAKANAVCEKCSDDRKDKPVVGMTIIRNAKQSAGDKDHWEGGEILDPNNGKTYKLRMKPLEGGKKLEVRGYVGPFHRNQIWIRVE